MAHILSVVLLHCNVIAVVFALILHYTKTIGKSTTRKRVHDLKVTWVEYNVSDKNIYKISIQNGCDKSKETVQG